MKIKKNTIHEIVILPVTISGDSQTIFKLHMMNIDLNIFETVHSKPSTSYFH